MIIVGMALIDSPKNPRIVAMERVLSRGGRMPLEGARMLSEALDAGVVPEEVFFVEEEVDPDLLTRARSAGSLLTSVSPRALGRPSDLPTARGLVAAAEIPQADLASIRLSPLGVAVVLDQVQDPSNVGAVIRSAEAFAAEAVVLTAGSAFPFLARALRASASSALRLPIVSGVTAADALSWARSQGGRLVGAEARDGQEPQALAEIRPLVLVIGSEGRGISEEIGAALEGRITIPLAGRVESLNAAVAAAVLLYALSPKTSARNR